MAYLNITSHNVVHYHCADGNSPVILTVITLLTHINEEKKHHHIKLKKH